MTREDLVEPRSWPQDVAGVDVDVGGLAPSPNASGWWMSTRECGRAYRLPLAPPASSTAAIEAAIPMQIVMTSGLTYCMVS